MLGLLSSASGSLLDNVALIDALDASKATWESVNAGLAAAEATARELEAAAGAYRPAAARAAALYFVLRDLSALDPMYQFSLDAYAALFAASLRAAPRAEAVGDRLKSLNDHHTYAAFRYAARGLFERHKLLLALQMAVRVLALAGQVNADEWAFFLRGGQALDASHAPNPAPSWLSDEAWEHVCGLDALPAFRGVAASLEAAPSAWEAWFRAPEPEGAELPREWESRCGELQRLLLVRALRPDRVLAAASAFASNALGQRFVEPPVLDLGECLDGAAGPGTPLIFVLSPGVDPAEPLRKLAEERGMGGKLFSVALGQGQVRRRSRARHQRGEGLLA